MKKKIRFILLLLTAVVLPTNLLAQTNRTQSAFVGQWRGIITDGQENRSFDLDLKNASGGTLSGEMSFDEGKVPIPAFSFGKDNSVSFEAPQIMKFTGKATISTGSVVNGTDHAMSGEVIINSQKGTWFAHKVVSGGEKLNTAKEYANRGEAHFKKQAYKEGIRDFTEALKLEKTAILYISRGMIYKNEASSQSGTANNASASLGAFLDKPITVVPTNAILSLNLAIDDFTKAIKLNQNISHGFYGRGLARLDKCSLMQSDTGECRQALNDFSQAIKLNMNTADVYANRSLAYKKIGMVTEAAADERKAAELKGNQ